MYILGESLVIVYGGKEDNEFIIYPGSSIVYIPLKDEFVVMDTELLETLYKEDKAA